MTTREIDFRKMEETLNAWGKAIKRLRAQVAEHHVDTQVKYDKQLDELSDLWETAKDQLQVHRRTVQSKLNDVENGFGRAINEVQQSFSAIVQQFSKENDLRLGWAEGLTDQRHIDSLGWAEGLAQFPSTETSEGWAEGQAKDPDTVETVGWAEGYDKK